MWYRDFRQTTDDEVVACLDRTVKELAGVTDDVDDPPVFDGDVEVVAGPVSVRGRLTVPEASRGTIVFAHGSGSSRHSPRNRYVASVLNEAGLGTLLVDLLTTDEELDRANVFDIELLARRLSDVTTWLRTRPEASALPIAYFGASTGAGAALWAAAEPSADIAAVVSRGGRPDLAARRLDGVRAPTLLIVGGDDEVVLDLNRRAQRELRVRSTAGRRARRNPPVRRAGRPRSRRRPGARLVRHPSHPDAAQADAAVKGRPGRQHHARPGRRRTAHARALPATISDDLVAVIAEGPRTLGSRRW